MVLAAVAPMGVVATGELAIDVTQHDDHSATVTVTENGTPAANASVVVEPASPNDTYAGAGEYITDANGTVGLPAPNHSVRVSVSASFNNSSVSTTTMLTVNDGNATDGEDNFGLSLVTFIKNLGETDGPRGLVIAKFALMNNPGSPPAHAGPPNGTPGAPNGTLGAPNGTPGDGAPNETPGDGAPNGTPGEGAPEEAGSSSDDNGDATDGDSGASQETAKMAPRHLTIPY